MYNFDDIEFSGFTRHLPIEYKILEWRLVINFEVFSEMEKLLIGRMTRIRNEFRKQYFFTMEMIIKLWI